MNNEKLNEFEVPAGTKGAWLCVDHDGTEMIFSAKPIRDPNTNSYWTLHTTNASEQHCVELPNGSIEKLIGKKLTWKNEPYKL